MTSTIRITAARARRLLREVVAEAGRDRQVTGWGAGAYMWRGCPMCMVGRALARAGVSKGELRAMDGAQRSEIDVVRLPARVGVTMAARRVLSAAQQAQDHTRDRAGLSWGEALDLALAVRPYQRTAVSA